MEIQKKYILPFLTYVGYYPIFIYNPQNLLIEKKLPKNCFKNVIDNKIEEEWFYEKEGRLIYATLTKSAHTQLCVRRRL